MALPLELRNELYDGLPDAVRQELSSHHNTITVARGTRVVEAGKLPERLIILNSGRVETTVAVAGKNVSLGTSHAGKIFGLYSIIAGKAPEVTVTCLEDCQVTLISKKVFRQMLVEHPQMYSAVVKVLGSDLVSADRAIRNRGRPHNT